MLLLLSKYRMKSLPPSWTLAGAPSASAGLHWFEDCGAKSPRQGPPRTHDEPALKAFCQMRKRALAASPSSMTPASPSAASS
ncbi:hypothetical protein GUJ93_ZPchr0007g4718 [Zizania palustris]|uniref:Uncharacterized protein n=1 Tax=Zizania palustris TaxID=103762 RepID=A0A8J5VNM4_ZIZPA|nr:hypothetical protein GUJ93_ZPchr0007g4718 [Zizania palustris]